MYVYLCAVLIFLSETLEQAGEGRFYDTIEQPVWKSYRKSPYNIFFGKEKDVVLILEEVVATVKSISCWKGQNVYLEDCEKLAFVFDYSVSITAKGSQSEKNCLFKRGRELFCVYLHVQDVKVLWLEIKF